MKLKRFASGFVAAVMALAVLGTPLGDILPFVRESVATVASADTYTYGDFEYSVWMMERLRLPVIAEVRKRLIFLGKLMVRV